MTDATAEEPRFLAPRVAAEAVIAKVEQGIGVSVHVVKLGWVGLAFIAYSFTAAGPFGVEQAVKYGGPLLTIIALLTVPLLFVVPQILIVSELATMQPEVRDAAQTKSATVLGPIGWVQRAYGNCAGFFNSMTSLMHNFIDCAIYPNLFRAYVSATFFPDATDWEKMGIGFICICAGTCLSLLPARTVGHVTTILTFFVMGPFIAGIVIGAKNISPSRIGNIHAVYNHDEYEFGAFASIIIWLFAGWRGMGTMGNDVGAPSDFLKGLPLALCLGVFSFVGPLLVAVSIEPPPDVDAWEAGYMGVVFNIVLPGLGTGVAIAAAIGNVCRFTTAMVCYPRMLRSVADRGWAPRFFAIRHPRTLSPYYAVAAHSLVATAFLFLEFSSLVRLSTFTSASGYLLTATSVAILRFREPNAVRPIMYPKNKFLATVVVSGPVIVFTSVVALNMQTQWVATTGLAVYAAVLLLYFILVKIRGARSMDAAPPETVSEAAVAEVDATSTAAEMAEAAKAAAPVAMSETPADGAAISTVST